MNRFFDDFIKNFLRSIKEENIYYNRYEIFYMVLTECLNEFKNDSHKFPKVNPNNLMAQFVNSYRMVLNLSEYL